MRDRKILLMARDLIEYMDNIHASTNIQSKSYYTLLIIDPLVGKGSLIHFAIKQEYI